LDAVAKLVYFGYFKNAILGIHVSRSCLKYLASKRASSLNQQPKIKEGFVLKVCWADRHGLKWVFRNSFAYDTKIGKIHAYLPKRSF